MDIKLIGIIVVIILIVGVAVALTHRSGGSQNSTTSTSSQTTTTPHNTKTTTSQGLVSFEGTWSGEYHGKYGNGGWTWIIKKTSGGGYTGCLQTTGTYATNGWIPIQIQLSGNKITIGTVGPNAVTFTGTVTGSHASGTWKMTNSPEGGDWSGSKTGTAESLPCMPGHTTTQTQGTTHSSTTTHTTITSTTGGTGNLACNPPPPSNYQEAFNSLLQATINVLGSGNIQCVTASIVGGIQYATVFDLQNYNPSQAGDIGQEIANQLYSMGWNMTQVKITSSQVQIVAGSYNGMGFLGLITISPSGSGQATLTIQLQPTYG